MTLVISILFALYFLSMVWVIVGFQKLKTYVPNPEALQDSNHTGFTIVIPFRNEVDQLPKLISSLAHIKYPKDAFEVLLVDDESSDLGVRVIHSELLRLSGVLQTKLLLDCTVLPNKRVSGSPKKDAINTAICVAKYDWIITTDADCEVPKNWLKKYDQLIREQHPKMVCGPVVFSHDDSITQKYQFLDGLSLQGVTMSGFGWNTPILCNGANLAYAKEAFIEASGFSGNDHLASGDDIFMLEKMKRIFPKRIAYLKHRDAIVQTVSETSWDQVVNQRVRWASKTSQQKSWGTKLFGVLIFLTNIAVVICFLSMFFWPLKGAFLMAILAQKLLVDILVLTMTASFFKKPMSMMSTLFTVVIYPIITILVVFKSFSGTYTWKGRIFKK